MAHWWKDPSLVWTCRWTRTWSESRWPSKAEIWSNWTRWASEGTTSGISSFRITWPWTHCWSTTRPSNEANVKQVAVTVVAEDAVADEDVVDLVVGEEAEEAVARTPLNFLVFFARLSFFLCTNYVSFRTFNKRWCPKLFDVYFFSGKRNSTLQKIRYQCPISSILKWLSTWKRRESSYCSCIETKWE